MAKSKNSMFECSACGNLQAKWVGKCPDCGAWDSFVELKQSEIEFIKTTNKLSSTPIKAKKITEIEIENIKRISTDDTEL
ncbi:MAG: DNA repair protein RadA, partial [Campylobacter sp.]|nr:DNA repair protein RadA [Campylobacter sp.]